MLALGTVFANQLQKLEVAVDSKVFTLNNGLWKAFCGSLTTFLVKARGLLGDIPQRLVLLLPCHLSFKHSLIEHFKLFIAHPSTRDRSGAIDSRTHIKWCTKVNGLANATTSTSRRAEPLTLLHHLLIEVERVVDGERTVATVSLALFRGSLPAVPLLWLLSIHAHSILTTGTGQYYHRLLATVASSCSGKQINLVKHLEGISQVLIWKWLLFLLLPS